MQLREREPPSNAGESFVTIHALTATSRGCWIVDSGATCHMCNDKNLFSIRQQVILSDSGIATPGLTRLLESLAQAIET